MLQTRPVLTGWQVAGEPAVRRSEAELAEQQF
jgi:hypothetical protein